MTPLPSVPNMLKVTFTHIVGSDNTVDVIQHWGYSGSAPSAANCISLAASIQAAYASFSKTNLYTGFTMQSVTVLDLASSTGAEGTSASPFAGTLSGTELPANVCVVLNHQVAQRYRGGKGKSFFPWGQGGNLQTAQTWSSGFITTVTGNWASTKGAITGATAGGCTIGNQFIVSYYQGYNTPTTLPSGKVKQSLKLRTSPLTYQVAASVGSIRIGSQRRRVGKH